MKKLNPKRKTTKTCNQNTHFCEGEKFEGTLMRRMYTVRTYFCNSKRSMRTDTLPLLSLIHKLQNLQNSKTL